MIPKKCPAGDKRKLQRVLHGGNCWGVWKANHPGLPDLDNICHKCKHFDGIPVDEYIEMWKPSKK